MRTQVTNQRAADELEGVAWFLRAGLARHRAGVLELKSGPLQLRVCGSVKPKRTDESTGMGNLSLLRKALLHLSS